MWCWSNVFRWISQRLKFGAKGTIYWNMFSHVCSSVILNLLDIKRSFWNHFNFINWHVQATVPVLDFCAYWINFIISLDWAILTSNRNVISDVEVGWVQRLCIFRITRHLEKGGHCKWLRGSCHGFNQTSANNSTCDSYLSKFCRLENNLCKNPCQINGHYSPRAQLKYLHDSD